MFAQADGGLFGQGIGESLLRPIEGGQPLIPEVQTDFIYALIVNELGLFGGCGVILIYVLIAARGFKIATIAPDGFSKLLAAGLTAVFALQAFVIIGGVVRVIPLTGVTLPFVSYGGSSVLANMVLLALLLLISDRARRPQRTGRGASRERPDRPPLRRRPRALRAARRLHQQLVGLRRRGARGEDREQAAAARGAADRARQDPHLRRRADRREPAARARASRCATSAAIRRGALFGNPIGYSFFTEGSSGFERSEEDVLTGNENEFVSLLDQIRGQRAGGLRHRHDARRRRAAAGDRPARPAGEPGRGGRDRAADRRRPGDGVARPGFDPNTVPDDLEQLNKDDARAAAQPLDPVDLPARLDDEGRDRRRRARLGRVHAGHDPRRLLAAGVQRRRPRERRRRVSSGRSTCARR